MQFVISGQRIAVENFVTGKLYTILWRNDTEVNLMCTSIGADCVVFQGEAPLNLFTLTMKNADTIDTIEPTQLGTTNYNNLINKPSINGVDLIGNKTSSALGIRDVPAVIEADEGKVLTAADDGSYSWQVIPEGTTDYTDLSNKPQINSVTLSGNLSLSDLGAAAAADIPTTPADIGAEPAITSENKLDPTLIDYDSTHAAITAAQVEQIGTNQNNILSVQAIIDTNKNIGYLKKNVLNILSPTETTKETVTPLSNGGVQLDISGATWTSAKYANIPVSQGVEYTLTVYVDEYSGTGTFVISFKQIDGDGAQILTNTITGTGTKTRTFTPTGDTVWLGLYLNNSGTAATATAKVRAMICPSSSDNTVFTPYAPSNAELYQMILNL